MSGKNSRQRRKDAVNKARDDVYKNNGEMFIVNPFDNERQARIYAKHYPMFMNTYSWCESLHKDMCRAYGCEDMADN